VFVPVDQQHRAGRQVRAEGLAEARRRRVYLAAVDQPHGAPGGPRAAAELVRQCRLADAPGAVQEQHPPGGPAGQRGAERGQLVAAPDEAELAGTVEQITELRHETPLVETNAAGLRRRCRVSAPR
jgi:hypothetical protein